jgi:tetratricopeptide (TPR) repeat protein
LFFTIAGLRPEVLFPSLPPWSLTALIFIIWVMPGLFFQYRQPEADLKKRLWIYGSVVAGTFTLLIIFSPAARPEIYLSAGLLPVTLLILPVFLILIAHEIPAGLINIIGRAGSERNGFRDFLILISIYLINLFALYLSDLRWFEWSYGIHPIFLLLVSGILSLWGVRYQQKQLEGFMNAEPHGVLLMSALGLISFSGIAFFYLSGNDALFATFRELSLYIHIAYGIVFATYIISNFSPLLLKGVNVSTVLYQPTLMPFFTFRFGGLVATLAFVFYNIWQRPVNDVIGGYYNALAGYHRIAGDQTFSDGYLKIAARYAYHNHQSNVLLAERELEKGNADRAKIYFQNALERRPTEQTYLSLVNLLEINGKSLESFTYLKDGLKKFPGSPYLLNALGLTNYGLNSPDSAIWYFEQAAAGNGKGSRSAEINIQALRTREQKISDPDSVLKATGQKNLAATANILAVANTRNQSIATDFITPTDSVFSDGYAAWLNNWLINNRGHVSEEIIKQTAGLIEHPENRQFAEALHVALGIAAYGSGFVNQGVEQLEKAVFTGEDKGRHNNTLALWMLEQGAAGVAVRYNDFAVQQEFKDAALTRAVLLAEAGRIPESIISWDTLGRKGNSTIQFLSELSKRALGVQQGLFDDLSDEEQYAFLRYRLKVSDSVLFKTLLNKIPNNDLKAKAIHDRAYKLFESGLQDDAIRIYKLVEGIPITNEKLFHDIQLLELRMLAESGQPELLKSRMTEKFIFNPGETAYRKYFEALTALPDTTAASKSFEWIERNNLWCTDGIIGYSYFLSGYRKDPLAAYSLLARALHRNPYSVRLLKAYITSAAVLGFLDYAGDAITSLQAGMDAAAFREFMAGLPPAINQP